MTEDKSSKSEMVGMRELSFDELQAVAGAGFISWLRGLFGVTIQSQPAAPITKSATTTRP